MNSRKCTRCEQVKPAAEFYARNAGGTLQSACKACVKARAVAWSKAHPERRREILHRHGAKRRRKSVEDSAQVLTPQADRKEEL
jgi:hypothetical protein